MILENKQSDLVPRLFKSILLILLIWLWGNILYSIILSGANIAGILCVIFTPVLILFILSKPRLSFLVLLFARPLLEPLYAYKFQGISILGLFSLLYILIAAQLLITHSEFKIKHDILTFYYLLMVVAALSVLMSTDMLVSVMAMIRCITLLSLFLLGYNLIKNMDEAMKLVKIVVLSSIFPILLGIYQSIMGLGVQEFKSFQGALAGVKRINATFSLSNGFAFFLALIILLSIDRKSVV